MTAKELMETEIVTLNQTATLKEVCLLARNYKQDYFPVVNDDAELVGILSEQQLLHALYSDLTANDTIIPTSAQLHKTVKNIREAAVSRYMATDVIGVYPWTTLEQIGAQMIIYKLAKVPVVDKRKLLGVVSSAKVFIEIMRASASDAVFAPTTNAMTLGRSNSTLEQEAADRQKQVGEVWRSIRKDYNQKRMHMRAEVRLEIGYRMAGDTQQLAGFTPSGKVYTKNISAGGLMLEFEEKLVPGLLFEVRFNLHQNEEPIESLCRVCWVDKSPQPGRYYAGVSFLAITSKDRYWIERFVEKQST
ncbi:MAG: CBS domain-containing protein [Candidatus Omnitrophota bacterium]